MTVFCVFATVKSNLSAGKGANAMEGKMSGIINKALIFISLVLFSSLGSAQVHRTDQIEVELLAETLSVVPGETLWLAIRLKPIDHWHTYWQFGL